MVFIMNASILQGVVINSIEVWDVVHVTELS